MLQPIIDINVIECRGRGDLWAELLADVGQAVKVAIATRMGRLDEAGLTTFALELGREVEMMTAAFWYAAVVVPGAPEVDRAEERE